MLTRMWSERVKGRPGGGGGERERGGGEAKHKRYNWINGGEREQEREKGGGEKEKKEH